MKSNKGRWLSPEREEYLRREYAAGTDKTTIEAGLRSLPGGELPSWPAIKDWCRHRQIFRPSRRPYHKRERPKVPSEPTVPRTCLRCRRPFDARTRFIRLCHPCGDHAAHASSAIA